jgi:hypothetical protein
VALRHFVLSEYWDDTTALEIVKTSISRDSETKEILNSVERLEIWGLMVEGIFLETLRTYLNTRS